MDKIYSRHRVRIPNKKQNGKDTVKIKKIYFTMLIFIISFATGYKLLKSIDPIFDGLCIAKAQSIATEITNTTTSKILAKYSYKDTVQIIKSEDGKSNILKTDIVTINEITSEIALEIQKALNDISKEYIEIPIGALSRQSILVWIWTKSKNKINTCR